MNKYEQYLHKVIRPIEYVRAWLSYHYAWCHIDELIANPAIFPEQTLSLEDRRAWAFEAKESGASWVITRMRPREMPDCLFALEAVVTVPAMRYRHISKAWRLANEQV